MLKNGLYNIIGAVIRVGITFLTIPVIIRLMGVEEYGLWTLVSTVIGIVGLAEGGLSISTTVFLSRDLANEDVKAISQTLTISFIGMLVLADVAALILWVGAPEIIKLFTQLKREQLAIALPALRYGGFIIWARLLQQIFIAIEQSYQQYALMNFLNTVQTGFTNVGMIAVAWFGGTTLALMQWNTVVAFAMLFAHGWGAWQLLAKTKPRLIWSHRKGRELIEYSFMTWLTSLGSALFQAGDRLVVGSVLDTTSLGAYAAITSITNQINQLSAMAIQPLLPRLGSLLEGKRRELIQQIKQAFQVNVLLVIGLGGVLLIFAPIIINILFSDAATPEYKSAFRLATVVYMFYSVNVVGYYALLGLGFANLSMRINLIAGVLSLTSIFIGAHFWGLQGAIAGNFGYATTLAFVFVAMKQLNIQVKEWMGWLQPSEILLLPRLLFSKFILMTAKSK
ncbi:oligosaccharide flippase family protein [Brunnivagina elsteri]|uniref:Polysaccharide biosynthesis protein n=1 Tax=Brunnivagina elsteri CCALA 953 TaxID=987040 RepID=A0A2A2THD7_9CYAN|nr:oligosaccharide flippase family protein [Calothrix elsteri]PAX53160.1 polysaccharide biosynthesis protein [Calothrix elsteri CCALA 953]